MPDRTFDRTCEFHYAGEFTAFIGFMLASIKASLTDALKMSDGMSDAPAKSNKATDRWNVIQAYLSKHPFIMNADVRALCNVSTATANRILAGLVSSGKLEKCRENGWWIYTLKG